MGAQNIARAIGFFVEVKCVMLLPRRMIGWHVERIEVMKVIFNMRAFGHAETEIAEDLHHFFPDL